MGLNVDDIQIKVHLVGSRTIFVALDTTAEKTAAINANMKKVDKSLKKASSSGKKLSVTLDKSAKNAKKVDGAVKKTTRSLNKAAVSGKQFLSSFEKSVIVVNQLLELVRKVAIFGRIAFAPLAEAGAFEQYRIVLKNLLGDVDEADKRFRAMVQFAAVTPFNVPGIVEAGNRLEALGQFSMDTIRMLGDLAAASGKDVMQAVEAFTNLVTGRTGFAVKQFRAMLISTDDWTQEIGKQVLKTASGAIASVTEMLEALPNIIRKKGFAGLMDEQSKTFIGRISNMQDAWQQFLASVGDLILDKAKLGIEGLTESIGFLNENVSRMGRAIEGAMALVFVIGAPILGLAVLNKVMTAVTLGFFAMSHGAAAVVGGAGKASIAVGILGRVFIWFGALIKTHPMFLAAIGLLALIKAFVTLRNTLRDTTKDQIEFNRKIISKSKERVEELESERDAIESMGESLQKLKKFEEEFNTQYKKRVLVAAKAIDFVLPYSDDSIIENIEMLEILTEGSKNYNKSFARDVADIVNSINKQKKANKEYQEALLAVGLQSDDLVVSNESLSISITDSEASYILFNKTITDTKDKLAAMRKELIALVETQLESVLELANLQAVLEQEKSAEAIGEYIEGQLNLMRRLLDTSLEFIGIEPIAKRFSRVFTEAVRVYFESAENETELKAMSQSLIDAFTDPVNKATDDMSKLFDADAVRLKDLFDMEVLKEHFKVSELIPFSDLKELETKLTLIPKPLKEMMEQTVKDLLKTQLELRKILADPKIESDIERVTQNIKNNYLDAALTIEEKLKQLQAVVQDFSTSLSTIEIRTELDVDEVQKELALFRASLKDEFPFEVDMFTQGFTMEELEKMGIFMNSEFIKRQKDFYDKYLTVHKDGTGNILRIINTVGKDVKAGLIRPFTTAITGLQRQVNEQKQRDGKLQGEYNKQLTLFKNEYSKLTEKFNREISDSENLSYKERYENGLRSFSEYMINIKILRERLQIQLIDVFTPELFPKLLTAAGDKFRTSLEAVDKNLRKQAADSLRNELKIISTSSEFFKKPIEDQITTIKNLILEYKSFVSIFGALELDVNKDLFGGKDGLDVLRDSLNNAFSRLKTLAKERNQELRDELAIAFQINFGINKKSAADAKAKIEQLYQEIGDLDPIDIDISLDPAIIKEMADFEAATLIGESTKSLEENFNRVEKHLKTISTLRDTALLKIKDVIVQEKMLFETEEAALVDRIVLAEGFIVALQKDIPEQQFEFVSKPGVTALIRERGEVLEGIVQALVNLTNQLMALRGEQGRATGDSQIEFWNDVLDVARVAQHGLVNIIRDLTNINLQAASRQARAWAEAENEKIDAARESAQERIDAEEEVAVSFARTRLQEEKIREEFRLIEEEAEAEAEKRKEEIEDEKEARILAVRKQQFERNKIIAISNILISIAEFVAKVAGNLGAPGIFIGAALGAALSTAQLAIVSAQQFPGFSKGGFVDDKDTTGDGKLIRVNEKGEEFVVNAKATKKNRPLLEAINTGKEIGSFIKGGFTGVGDMLSQMLMGTSLPQNNLAMASAGMASTQVSRNDSEILAELKELNRNSNNDNLLDQLKKLNGNISNGDNEGANATNLLKEVKELNKNIVHYIKHPVAPIITKGARKEIVKDGISSIRRSSL